MSIIKLPVDIEARLEGMAESTHTSKSRIIQDALVRYLEEFESNRTPFELGKDIFGPAGSGRNDLSKNFKSLVKKRIRAKHPG